MIRVLIVKLFQISLLTPVNAQITLVHETGNSHGITHTISPAIAHANGIYQSPKKSNINNAAENFTN